MREMRRDYSDGEGSVEPDTNFVNTTADMEVELRLPLEVEMKQDQPREDVPTYSGAVDPGAVDLGQDERRLFEHPNGAKPKWRRNGLQLPIPLEPRRQLWGGGGGGGLQHKY